MKELRVAIAAARASERILKRHFGKLTPRDILALKKGGSVVTKVDHACERIIRKTIRDAFPGHAILGEEFGRTGRAGKPLWIVDPLDGTTNYTIGNPLFGTMVGLVVDGNVVLNVIALPIVGGLYHALVGRGAYRDGRRIHVSRTSRLNDAIVNVGFTHDIPPMRRGLRIHGKIFAHVRNARQFATGAVAFPFVASGRIDASLMPEPSHAWDVAPGILLVREAGGTVTDLTGRPWTLKSREHLASNGRIHAKLLRLIRS